MNAANNEDISYASLDQACNRAFYAGKANVISFNGEDYDREGGPIGSAPKSLMLHLGRARMWEGADELDFRCWVRFVQKHIGDHVDVIAALPTENQHDVVLAQFRNEQNAILSDLDHLFTECWGE